MSIRWYDNGMGLPDCQRPYSELKAELHGEVDKDLKKWYWSEWVERYPEVTKAIRVLEVAGCDVLSEELRSIAEDLCFGEGKFSQDEDLKAAFEYFGIDDE
jgi:hypothetical protein